MTPRTLIVAAVGALAAVWAWNTSPRAQTSAAGAPSFNAGGQLVRPTDYREWVFVTSGLGMTYGPAQAAGGHVMFDNVFVTADAYGAFLRTGKWPDRTMFVLEMREAQERVSINNGGRTQGGVMAIEASVKDPKRFPDGGWGYFSFDSRGGLADATAPLPKSAACYSCHGANTAVENTFVQFYPTLFDVAKRFGTIKATYDPDRKP